jgi:hypothetical protein
MATGRALMDVEFLEACGQMTAGRHIVEFVRRDRKWFVFLDCGGVERRMRSDKVRVHTRVPF